MSDEQAVVNVIHGGSPSESVMEVPLNETSRVTLVEQIKVKYGEHPKRYRNYAILIASFVVYMIVCVCWYTYYEGWDVDISFAFVVETMTTVGFGYHTPSDDRSRLFTIVVMIFGIFVIFGGISSALTHRLDDLKKKKKVHLDENVGELFKDFERRFWINLVVIIGSLFVASGFLVWLEDWTFATALYFAVQTATSVGYGDIPLNQGATRIFVELYTFFSTILLAFAISNLHGIYQEKKALKKALMVAERKQALGHIKMLDTGNGVARDTFILAVLEQLGKIDRENDIEPWIKKFEEFDTANTGVIHGHEIEQLSICEYNLAAEQIERIKTLEGSNMRSSLSEAFGLVVGTASGGPIHGMHGMHAVSDPSGVMHNRATSPHHTHAIGGTETGAGAGTGGDDSIGRFSVSAGRSSAGVEIL